MINNRTAILTGFEPFDNNALNPSWEAVAALPEQIGIFRIEKIRLPVTFNGAFAMLENSIRDLCPDLVICTGLAEKRNAITVERVAINIDDARIPDNKGFQPIDMVIDYAAPNAYFSNLPVKQIIKAVSDFGVSAAISESAGTYVCNNVMFRLLNLIATEMPMMMGGFIHVPKIVENRDRAEFGGFSLNDLRLALETSVKVCSDRVADGLWHGSQRMIVAYKSAWSEEFETIRAQLKTGLGNLALRIDHIGSTSVPGLAAKDIIDVQITVADLSEELLKRMQQIGYKRAEHVASDHQPPGIDLPQDEWQKWFFRAPPGQRPTNTHVRILGRANQRYAMLFRDFLLEHSDYAEAYARLKIRLAENLANKSNYSDVKDPAVDLIYFAAEKWAAEKGWRPA